MQHPVSEKKILDQKLQQLLTLEERREQLLAEITKLRSTILVLIDELGKWTRAAMRPSLGW